MYNTFPNNQLKKECFPIASFIASYCCNVLPSENSFVITNPRQLVREKPKNKWQMVCTYSHS